MFNRPPPQWTQEQVIDEMTLLGIEDPLIHEGYFLHYESQGWTRGNGQPIMNLRAHITALKNSDFLCKLRKYATKPKPKPKKEIPLEQIEVVSPEERRKALENMPDSVFKRAMLARLRGKQ